MDVYQQNFKNEVDSFLFGLKIEELLLTLQKGLSPINYLSISFRGTMYYINYIEISKYTNIFKCNKFPEIIKLEDYLDISVYNIPVSVFEIIVNYMNSNISAAVDYQILTELVIIFDCLHLSSEFRKKFAEEILIPNIPNIFIKHAISNKYEGLLIAACDVYPEFKIILDEYIKSYYKFSFPVFKCKLNTYMNIITRMVEEKTINYHKKIIVFVEYIAEIFSVVLSAQQNGLTSFPSHSITHQLTYKFKQLINIANTADTITPIEIFLSKLGKNKNEIWVRIILDQIDWKNLRRRIHKYLKQEIAIICDNKRKSIRH